MHHKLTSTRTSPLAPAGASSHRQPASGTLLTLLAAIPLLLAACSADPNSEPAFPSTTQATALASEQTPSAMKASIAPSQTPSSTSPTATPSPRPSTTIQPPIPSGIAFENSADGAEAYAYFLFQAWWYLINTHDIDWWDTSIPECGWKSEMRAKADKQIYRGITDELAPFTPYIFDSRVNPDNPNEFMVTMRADIAEIYSIDAQGTRTVSVEAETHELVARLLFDQGHWRAVAIVNKEAQDQTR